MESNNLYHHFFKYLFFGLEIIMLNTSILSWFFPELFWVNGEKMEQSIVTTLVFGMIGIVCFIIFIAIKDKFVIVKLGGQIVTIKNGKNERKINWMEVESLSLIQFVYPPLYKLKVKEDNKVYWFNTENKFIMASGFIKDLENALLEHIISSGIGKG
ncbi:hypothetical protein Belba_0095 [Belliella baltica DSM 15883]|uniref:Uncharacterized protein n=1 Tax=Belliella baltica (strain DSM 15883 / CIP 108006 / LMG 21964 / BA134) TaxID=866536 RepID=I3Z0J8_BELBD|nr:hypothetical protein [Belliella baltica]AFL82766.1 hypothetical protein Belba_0095 [Belliella baltica DSM 15883]